MPFSEKIKQLKPLFGFNSKKPKFCSFTSEEKYQIDNSNKYFFYRLKNQNSALSLRKLEKDFQKSQLYKKSICAYPSIDFHNSIQRKIEKEKKKNQKKFYNTSVSFYNNLFNKTKFKEVKLFTPNKRRSNKTNEKEKSLNGETKIKNESKEFGLYFIIRDKNNQNKKVKVEKCKKDNFFFDIVDKLCREETNLEKDKIKTDEFTINGRTEGKEYIDYNDTLEGNNLEGNEEINIKFKNDDENENKKNK